MELFHHCLEVVTREFPFEWRSDVFIVLLEAEESILNFLKRAEVVGCERLRDGRSDDVLKVQWGPRSIYCPPDGWYHQHFNSGSGPARHLAIYGPPTSSVPGYVYAIGGDFSGNVSLDEGGTLIDYEDEDPQIRKDFEEALRRKGNRCGMPPLTYRVA